MFIVDDLRDLLGLRPLGFLFCRLLPSCFIPVEFTELSILKLGVGHSSIERKRRCTVQVQKTRKSAKGLSKTASGRVLGIKCEQQFTNSPVFTAI